MRRIVMAGLLVTDVLAGSAGLAQSHFVASRRSPPASRPDWRVAEGASATTDAVRDRSDIRDRINDGRKSGQLSRREARQLRHEDSRIGEMARHYGRDGLSDDEARELATRATVLRSQVDAQRLIRPAGAKPR